MSYEDACAVLRPLLARGSNTPAYREAWAAVEAEVDRLRADVADIERLLSHGQYGRAYEVAVNSPLEQPA